jgi:hypothetical protein
MPRATDELRAEWGIDEAKATRHLENAGYKLLLDGSYNWLPPSGSHQMTDKERSAMWFLATEWDYGWLKE